MILNQIKLKELIKIWLEEDIGFGDVTTHATIPNENNGIGLIGAKSQGVIAGLPIVQAIFSEVDPQLEFKPLVEEGQWVEKGTVLAEVNGKVASILTGERVALNVIQRMSGIATKTYRLVQAAKQGNPNIRIADTRKTTPGLRMIEKYAVTVGGGTSHRYGLFDAVLIKDNHIKASGGILKAVEQARKAIPHTMTIEVEVESIPQVLEALEAKADIIMFDNMSIKLMKEALSLIGDQALTEASGGIMIDNIADIAALGVDVISMGSLTYSVEALDISLDLFDRKDRD
ncbi:carboxylating nicotinate-nucleotide diphosphorylase [Ammoniphilus sp. YIM 78166]|uniref:carboxylating nicotinate-nucleotide diphosphorylase n=1 Tax=Ammoniphilus sp. YIM 78166 TaxID=1644106 RepID=UPI0010702466|nr:carboxylating nicotinate-nucleotide diphosphorylase [Ammoniphilus sp. YIM 78166]